MSFFSHVKKKAGQKTLGTRLKFYMVFSSCQEVFKGIIGL